MSFASPERGRYIVRSEDAALLHEALAALQADPAAELLHTIGPPAHPHTAILLLPHTTAQHLRLQYAGRLIIEPDRPLSLFTASGGPASTEETAMPKQPENTTPAPPTPPQAADGGTRPHADTAPQARGRHVGARERRNQYLIAPRRSPHMQLMGVAPLSFGYVEQSLRAAPDIDVVDTVGPKNMMGMLADGFGDVPSVLVARMPEQKAAALHQQAQGRLIVERDQPLMLSDPAFLPPLVAGTMQSAGTVLPLVVAVLAPDGSPLKDAEVYVFGSLMPANGLTDDQGKVTLTLYGETLDSVRGLYVKPKADFWSFYQERPDLSADEANLVTLRPLGDWPNLSAFPERQLFTWGQRAMRLDQLPDEYRGQGVRVAVIDSGAARSHDDLKNIRFGFDIINKKTSPDTWYDDQIAHGSHCAGVIAGANGSRGVRGFAPDAEVHACKLFPGGQTSQLIDALEYCIEHQVDVVNMSLGGAEFSEALEQQILRAKRAGIACIVAAGNSSGPVQYPASSPNVLAVAAIGKLNEFPPDSYHTQTVTPLVDGNGFFAAKFSCHGPEVAVCAPGVAIPSSVPPNNFAVWDGTSMAAPHITGLAALVLAHHPDFQGPFKARTAERVERLFQVIRASARRLALPDATRTGYGLPDVPTAVGLQSHAGVQTQAANPFAQAYVDPAVLLQAARTVQSAAPYFAAQRAGPFGMVPPLNW